MKNILFFTACLMLFSCRRATFDTLAQNGTKSNLIKAKLTVTKPNIILVLTDDIGYEVPAYTGGRSYSTPNLDLLASQGVQYMQCHATPLCSPSRQELLTGLYGFRNYKHWGILDTSNVTIANILKAAGYSTCIAGKWQLDGGDAAIHKFGFDKYSVWLPFAGDDDAEAGGGSHYKNPVVYQDSGFLTNTAGQYGEDIFRQYLFNFIDSSTKPFFALWTPNLCHSPFQPTPDDPEFLTAPGTSNIKWFPSMVKYLDKEIGLLKAKADSIPNTYIFFITDNGTDIHIYSNFKDTLLKGGKGSPEEIGTRVPMIMYKTGGGAAGIDSQLIDFTDFFPTIAHLAGAAYGFADGNDFLSTHRTYIFQHFQLKGIDSPSWRFMRWAQTLLYKKYDTVTAVPNNVKAGKFFKIFTDGTPDRQAVPSNNPQKKADTLLTHVFTIMH